MTSHPAIFFRRTPDLHYVANRRHRRALTRLCLAPHDHPNLKSLSARVLYFDSDQCCRQASFLNATPIYARPLANVQHIRLP